MCLRSLCKVLAALALGFILGFFSGVLWSWGPVWFGSVRFSWFVDWFCFVVRCALWYGLLLGLVCFAVWFGMGWWEIWFADRPPAPPPALAPDLDRLAAPRAAGHVPAPPEIFVIADTPPPSPRRAAVHPRVAGWQRCPGCRNSVCECHLYR